MQSIRHQGRSYSVLFQIHPSARIGKRGFEAVEETVALILDDDQRTVGIGSAVRAERDEADDAVGAEIALRRALQSFTEDKQLRAKFWEAFHHAVVGELKSQQRELLEQRLEQIVADRPHRQIVGDGITFNGIPLFPMQRIEDVRI